MTSHYKNPTANNRKSGNRVAEQLSSKSS